MPALPPYIPPRDANLNNWLVNFSTLITAAPATYGLLTSDAVTIQDAVDNWSAAYALVTSPTTKTAQTVSDKNTQKVVVLAVVRPYAQNIGLNPGVSSANKIALGLNPRTSTPSPVTPPTSTPILSVQAGGNLSLIMRYRDSAASVSVKAKPYGVTRMQLFGTPSATPITNPELLAHIADPTKSPFVVTFPSSAAGMQCYLAGRWVIRTGGFSPWSPIIAFTVPQGA